MKKVWRPGGNAEGPSRFVDGSSLNCELSVEGVDPTPDRGAALLFDLLPIS